VYVARPGQPTRGHPVSAGKHGDLQPSATGYALKMVAACGVATQVSPMQVLAPFFGHSSHGRKLNGIREAAVVFSYSNI